MRDQDNKTEKKPDAETGEGDPMAMGMKMARKMMKRRGKGGPGPMAMMQKMMGQMNQGKDGGPSMPPMMQMCMGMCGEMLTAIEQTTDIAVLATPELRRLFDEWLVALEDEALRHLKENGETDASGLAKALNIGEESAIYLIARLAKSGRLRATVRPSQ